MAEDTQNPKEQVPAVEPEPKIEYREPDQMTLKYNHRDLELPTDEVRILAQKGLKVQSMEEEVAKFRSESERNAKAAEFLKLGEKDPEMASYLDQMYNYAQGTAPRPQFTSAAEPNTGADAWDQSPQTPPSNSHTVALEAELREIKEHIAGDLAEKQNQRRLDAIEQSIGRQAFLKDQPELQGLAQKLADAAMLRDKSLSPVEAAAAANEEIKQSLERRAESERSAREKRLELQSIPSSRGVPDIAAPETKPTKDDLFSGKLLSNLKERLNRAVSSQD